MKKKNLSIKIVSVLVLFLCVFSFSYFTYPVKVSATSDIGKLYLNPNQSNDTYKFKLSDVVSSGMLTSIVGCTGVVNKVSTWMSTLLQSPEKIAEQAVEELENTKKQLKQACSAIKSGSELGAGLIAYVNNLVKPLDTTLEKWCPDKTESINDDMVTKLTEQSKIAKENSFKEQCFDGIAITLAKNQLTSMTRNAMNWVNTGMSGNPFYAQNISGLMNDVEQNVVETGIDVLISPSKNQNPYAYDFSQAKVSGMNIGQSSSNFLSSLKSNLSSFITDKNSYYTNDQLDAAQRTEDALNNAQNASNNFASDFSTGGWNGWLALTQIDQNNPLGFNMRASQYLADSQAKKASETRDELLQNNGFLSQKECVEWQLYDDYGEPLRIGEDGEVVDGDGEEFDTGLSKGDIITTLDEEGEPVAGSLVYSKTRTKTRSEFTDELVDKCAPDGWKVITPGSIIKDKVTNYLNSPERQLELAKTINDSLNALFSILISKLEDSGLSGLSDKAVSTGYTSPTYTSSDGNTPYDNNGAYDGFNLTSDLGNTYIHSDVTYLGKWNANTNKTTNSDPDYKLYDNDKLYFDGVYGTVDGNNEKINISPNSYYTVSTAGNTEIINKGYNGWAVGDRAFWNGSEWQNWKAGQTSPVDKRGVIQIQQDYIVAAKEILKILPKVMPSLGELDYCIPGPNPSYKTNSTDAQSAYQDWIGSMYVGPKGSSGVVTEWRIDHEGTRTFETLKNIFADNLGVWNHLLAGAVATKEFEKNHKLPMFLLNNFDIGWLDSDGKCQANLWNNGVGEDGQNIPPIDAYAPNCINSYYNNHGAGKEFTDEKGNGQGEYSGIKNRTDKMNSTIDYVNSHRFQDFYSTFTPAMDNLYFKNITKMYIENEYDPSLNKLNPAYIPMAQSGLDFTKNINYYNNDITKATKEYTDYIAQAKVNIAKLDPIKTEVSQIIKAAQDRRNKDLVDKLGLTIDKIRNEYASCFAEENIKFFDEENTSALSGAVSERCSNGVDDDLDGLADSRDPDCQNNSINNTANGSCVYDNTYGKDKNMSYIYSPSTGSSTGSNISINNYQSYDSQYSNYGYTRTNEVPSPYTKDQLCGIKSNNETACNNSKFYYVNTQMAPGASSNYQYKDTTYSFYGFSCKWTNNTSSTSTTSITGGNRRP